MVEMLRKEFQMTIVMAAHDLEGILEKADQCIFMKDGQIKAAGSRRKWQKHCGNMTGRWEN